ncbi:hypothetical protein HDV57DRAFT_500924 [Trichoderma longibrachiatum]|uniref:Uncharacterized protein n=1 Tax=Trichoderma longibrachiatum ATCC 18648 TaxID=983965 RepID=A0A2T4C6M6_TRILO|nr:hypothetical protein M440DRAFT_1400086 [Trichoderma longibrachiatum ATCC 18648]
MSDVHASSTRNSQLAAATVLYILLLPAPSLLREARSSLVRDFFFPPLYDFRGVSAWRTPALLTVILLTCLFVCLPLPAPAPALAPATGPRPMLPTPLHHP